MTTLRSHRRHCRSLGCVRAWAWLVGSVLWWCSAEAFASGRDDVKLAYIDAAEKLDKLELDAALGIVDAALDKAKDDALARDPSLAPLYAMRGGLLYARDQDRQGALDAFKEAARLDYNVRLPIELRSKELASVLDEARTRAVRPSESVVHVPPRHVADKDLEFAALVNASLPDGATMVLYWRLGGGVPGAEFSAMYMDVFGNFGTAKLTAAEHRGQGVEYFIYAFDAKQQALANRGDKDHPLLVQVAGGPTVVSSAASGSARSTQSRDRGSKAERKPRNGGSSRPIEGLPRFFFNVGVGTGVGLGRGTTELSYEQYAPGVDGETYGAREQACAIERWYAGAEGLAPDSATFGAHLAELGALDPTILPVDPAAVEAAYDPGYCSRRHSIRLGVASAPLHLVPEFGVRIGRAIVVSVFGRLQVITGSKVYIGDPAKSLPQSYAEDVRSADPQGVVTKVGGPLFTFAVGAKFKYFFGKDTNRLRWFVGGFAGYGFARLRIPLGFANDENSNSVPDDLESPIHGDRNDAGQVIVDTCVAAWPYNLGCDPALGEADRSLADSVRSSSSGERRVDTVLLGPGFVGAAIGLHYQIIPNLGVYAELNLGGWFPNTSSGLLDINLGPAITF